MKPGGSPGRGWRQAAPAEDCGHSGYRTRPAGCLPLRPDPQGSGVPRRRKQGARDAWPPLATCILAPRLPKLHAGAWIYHRRILGISSWSEKKTPSKPPCPTEGRGRASVLSVAAVCLCLGVGALLPGAPPQLPLPWGQACPGRALVVGGRSLGGPTPGQQGASLQSSAPPGASCLSGGLSGLFYKARCGLAGRSHGGLAPGSLAGGSSLCVPGNGAARNPFFHLRKTHPATVN